jgi:hypothetical protein
LKHSDKPGYELASGDFGNVVKTVAELPTTYNKQVTVTLNPATLTPYTYTLTSKASPLGKGDNKMDYVNRLSPEQRDQCAPLSDGRLPNILAQPRRDEQ